MDSLISDCLPPIFSYLTLPDLLNLWQVSRRFKQEVEDYLPNVRSLPLYLTTPRTPKKMRFYNLFRPKRESIMSSCYMGHNNNNSYRCVCRFSGVSRDQLSTNSKYQFSKDQDHEQSIRRYEFGPSGFWTIEDETILQNQRHFRFADFYVLNHSSALTKFLPFIKKHCPKIEKLALVIDDCGHYLPEVSKILKAFPGIKVLLIENTLQDSKPFILKLEYKSFSKFLKQRSELTLPVEVYNSILALENLEQLFFFPKRLSNLKIDTGSTETSFLSQLLVKLKVFHFNSVSYGNELGFKSAQLGTPLPDAYNGQLEELSCPKFGWILSNDLLVLPKLKRFFLLHSNTSDYGQFLVSPNIPNFELLPRPELKVFHVKRKFKVSEETMRKLNTFTGLESFHCNEIRLPYYDHKNGIVPEALKNKTIKHLRLIKSVKSQRNYLIWLLKMHFVALETVVFVEPEYSMIRVNELESESFSHPISVLSVNPFDFS